MVDADFSFLAYLASGGGGGGRFRCLAFRGCVEDCTIGFCFLAFVGGGFLAFRGGVAFNFGSGFFGEVDDLLAFFFVCVEFPLMELSNINKS